MKSGLVILILAAVLFVGAVYNSSFTFLFVEGVIVGEVTCSPQGDGKTYCCASVSDSDKTGYPVGYCTTCDDTNPPSNCSPREKPLVVVNPGKVLSNILEGGVLGEATTLPEVSVLEGQKANVTILPGGIIQEGNISSNDSSSSGILGTTGTVNDGEEQDESETTEEEQDGNGPSKGQAREGADEADDKENIDQELPLE